MSFMKEFMNGVMKKFEVFEKFYPNIDENNVDTITRLDDDDIEDFAYMHTLHDYMETRWGYTSPLNYYLERKKRLLISLNGLSRKEMELILRQDYEEDEEKRKSNWDRLTG